MLVTELGISMEVRLVQRVLLLVSIIQLQLFLLSKVGLSSATTIDVSPVHLEKAKFPMLVTELGMEIDVSPVQSEKAPNAMLVTELGIVISVSPVHLEKATSPILVTELGMVIDVSPVHS